MTQRRKIIIKDATTTKSNLTSNIKSKKNWIYWWILCALILISFLIFLWPPTKNKNKEELSPKEVNTLISTPPEKNNSEQKSDFPSLTNVDPSRIETEIIAENQSFATFLYNNTNVDSTDVARILNLPQTASIDQLQKGEIYDLIYESNEKQVLRYIIIDKKEAGLFQIRLLPYPLIKIKEQSIVFQQRTIGGIIKSDFINAIGESKISDLKIIAAVAESMKWSIDLFHLQAGDRFKLIFTEGRIGDRTSFFQSLDAVYFRVDGKDYYAFAYSLNGKQIYLDVRGRSIKRKFLKAPVKYGVITSNYNAKPERIHPVTGEKKAHFGTDFGAPKGAPIYAIADGTISKATFGKNNGNFVKIRHDKVYESQYLHMDSFAESAKVGQSIKQGEIIGYVGDTGLAKGYHVCLRLWKNKKQVDFIKEDINENSRVAEVPLDAFVPMRDSLLTVLQGVNYPSILSK